MNSPLFSSLSAGAPAYQRLNSSIPGMPMPGQQNPLPNGRFVFPPRPVLPPSITPAPGVIPPPVTAPQDTSVNIGGGDSPGNDGPSGPAY